MLNYDIIDPFPLRGSPVERDSAPKSYNEVLNEEKLRESRIRSKSFLESLISIFK